MSTTTEKWTIFGERLKAELERQGMSLRQFSEKTGITLATACRYIHSQRTPRATEILKAAKALGTTCDYMLGLSDDPHKTRDGWAKAGFHDLPPAQPETHEKRTETHACDCISRQAAIDAHYEYCNKHPNASFPVWSLKILEDLPSAQPDLSGYSGRLWKAAYERGKAEAQQRWIPCSEWLPEEYGEYRITWVTSLVPSKRFIGDSEYEVTSVWDEERKGFKGEWLLDDYIKNYPDVKVIAWKPLEEPYREEGD